MADWTAWERRLAQVPSSATVTNPWHDDGMVAGVDAPDAAARRREWMAAYWRTRRSARILVIAEAAGYFGCRFSGIPLTCERMLLGHHPRVTAADVFPDGVPAGTLRTSVPAGLPKPTWRTLGMNEPTDTVVWGTLLDAGLAPTAFALWNIFPFHPHPAGQVFANRTPTAAELAQGLDLAQELLALLRPERIIAVGRKSATTLQDAGVVVTAVRHPANGGVPAFRSGMAACLASR